MSEALLPVTPAAPFADPCAVVDTINDDSASYAAALADALRKKRGPDIPSEIVDAQDSLERRIRAHLAKSRVAVTLTDNRYTMISVRRLAKEKRYEVRLHHMFADADPVITRALARYIADNDAEASRVLGDFIDQNTSHVRGRARRQPTQVIFTAGEHHDLREIYDDLNARYFDNKIDAAITWGQRTGRPRRRNSIKMGSYSVEDRLIRIHRSLDRSFVPRFFVAWIVFHEMLHQVHDIRVKNGRREFHSKEFLADEAMYEHYDEAKLWERRHLDALLTY
ncbi:MAG TPA: hypothetical protein VMZ53_28365 [Kofleriaceae bacterium]|nr:hypothetical protein [Kofleriaceae bacterium]